VEAPGVEDGQLRGLERTDADTAPRLRVVAGRPDGQSRSHADSDCDIVTAPLLAAVEGYRREQDVRRLRLALLDVLRSLDD